MPAVTYHLVVDEFPETHEAKIELVKIHGPGLLQQWRDAKLPVTTAGLVYMVYRPGEIYGEGKGLTDVHRRDQIEAKARDEGGVPVAVTLTDVPYEEFVVADARFE